MRHSNAGEPPKKFLKVASQIGDQIRSGVLKPGKKVPSLRRFSAQFGTSVTTVMKAYWHLENLGLLEVRPQSGFYVRSVKPLLPEEPPKEIWGPTISAVSMTQSIKEIEYFYEIVKTFGNPNNFHISVTQSQFFPKTLRKALGLGYQRLGPEALEDFPWPPGNLYLRQQISRHYLDCGVVLPPEDILTTTGCTESLMVVLKALTRPGDIVAMESPLFPSLVGTVKSLGLRTVEIPLHPQEGMDLEMLGRALKRYRVKACITTPNFNAPMGCLMPDANKKKLVELLASHKVPLIEDDVAGDLYFGNHRPKPAKAFDKTGNVILCSSFSDTLGAGLRVGWVAGGNFHSRIVGCKFILNIGCNPAAEWGIGHFMGKGLYQRHLRKMRKYYSANLPVITQALTRNFPEGTRVSRPAGGFMLWVEFPPGVDTSKIWQQAPALGIVIVAGNYFCLNNQFSRHTAFNFGMPLSEKLEKAYKTIGDLAKKQLAEK